MEHAYCCYILLLHALTTVAGGGYYLQSLTVFYDLHLSTVVSLVCLRLSAFYRVSARAAPCPHLSRFRRDRSEPFPKLRRPGRSSVTATAAGGTGGTRTTATTRSTATTITAAATAGSWLRRRVVAFTVFSVFSVFSVLSLVVVSFSLLLVLEAYLQDPPCLLRPEGIGEAL